MTKPLPLSYFLEANRAAIRRKYGSEYVHPYLAYDTGPLWPFPLRAWQSDCFATELTATVHATLSPTGRRRIRREAITNLALERRYNPFLPATLRI